PEGSTTEILRRSSGTPQDDGAFVGIRLTETADRITVNTGAIEAQLSKKAFYLFKKIILDQNSDGIFSDNEVMTEKASLYLKFRGEDYTAERDQKTYQLEVEEKGPLKTVLKATGWFTSQSGKPYCQVIIRYYFYFGKAEVKVSHTLIYTGYPENKEYEPYQNLKLPENETIEAFGMRLPFVLPSNEAVDLTFGQLASAPGFHAESDMILYQRNYEQAVISTPAGNAALVKPLEGWIDVSDSSHGMSVSLRHLRENFPKAFKYESSGDVLQVDLWPEEAGELNLATTAAAKGPEAFGRGSAFGLGKTHELIFRFHPGDATIAKVHPLSVGFLKPLQIRPNPYWISATGAYGALHPGSGKTKGLESIIRGLFGWASRHPIIEQWYGMLNFGDTLTWWRPNVGWHPTGRWGWYNCEAVGTHTGALIQFLRTGDYAYFEFGENLTRHLMDVDTIHYDTISNDERLAEVLDPIYSQVGAMHRHNGNHWGGRSDEASHTNLTGILLYYHITGDERALDVAKEIGEYFLGEPFTYAGHPYAAPGRAMANALWGDVLLYEQTGDERYKKAADRLIDIFVRGQNPDGSFNENYNPILTGWYGEKHMLYMTSYDISAFISYHELTQDSEVFDMLTRMLRFLSNSEYSLAESLHGFAYVYLDTRDPAYLNQIERGLNVIALNRKGSGNPITDGLIYAKPIYHRPMTFMYTLPFVFSALETPPAGERQ
ncbi:glycoside hydrolase family 127 protein, partial [Omnitrophica bacterium]|nr:glycoside hydrolase family 127 protein [Candidatus Omnitrophota bacterium]